MRGNAEQGNQGGALHSAVLGMELGVVGSAFFALYP